MNFKLIGITLILILNLISTKVLAVPVDLQVTTEGSSLTKIKIESSTDFDFDFETTTANSIESDVISSNQRNFDLSQTMRFLQNETETVPRIRFTEIEGKNVENFDSEKSTLWKWIGTNRDAKMNESSDQFSDLYFDKDFLVVGEDVKNSSSILIQCISQFPAAWKHDGLKITPDKSMKSTTNSSLANESLPIFTITVHLGSRGFLKSKDKDTGNYTCSSIEENDGGGNLVSSIYVYIPEDETVDECVKSPCGLNAICEVRHGNRSCSCVDHYVGNPEIKCRPECVLNSDCLESMACVNSTCIDICELQLDSDEDCNTDQNSNKKSSPRELHDEQTENTIVNPGGPCSKSPCGENAYCEEKYRKFLAICHCFENYFGNPWLKCHAECLRREDCPLNLTCIQGTCQDPCQQIGACGEGSECKVVKQRASCSCVENFTGNPYRKCLPIERKVELENLSSDNFQTTDASTTDKVVDIFYNFS